MNSTNNLILKLETLPISEEDVLHSNYTIITIILILQTIKNLLEPMIISLDLMDEHKHNHDNEHRHDIQIHIHIHIQSILQLIIATVLLLITEHKHNSNNSK